MVNVAINDQPSLYLCGPRHAAPVPFLVLITWGPFMFMPYARGVILTSILMAATLVTGCSSGPLATSSANPLRPSNEFDPVLMEYFYEFVAAAKAAGVSTASGDDLTSIRFGQPGDETTLGYCTQIYEKESSPFGRGTTASLSWSEVVILPLGASPQEMVRNARFKSLMWHELGHCLFGLSHSKDTNSIMHATSEMDNDFIETNWNALAGRLLSDAAHPSGGVFTGEDKAATGYQKGDQCRFERLIDDGSK